MSEDLSHDPHLRAALRHAPDHALAPPAGVSQTILNAARQVHKPARPAATTEPAVRITVAPPRAIAWLRQWFASPRLAGGLATGLVAALGLGLWIDIGREPVIERAPPEAAKEPRRNEVAESVAAQPESERVPELSRNIEDLRQVQPAPAPRAPTPTAKRQAAEGKLEYRAESPSQQRPAPTPAATAKRREDAVASDSAKAKVDGAPAESTVQAAPPPAAAAQTAAAPGPAPVAEAAPTVSEATTASQKATTAAVESQRDAAARSDSRMSLAAGRAAAVAGARAPAAEPALDTAAAASPPFTLLRRARSDTMSGIARWTWMPPGKAAIVPMDDAAQAWLGRLVQASRGRWVDGAERAGLGDAVEVRWWRDDWPQATLRIESDGLRWTEHNGPTRHAPLDAATLQRLTAF